MPKITIRNLGPIKNIEDLEIKDVMVFIGPQASGKSTVAKAVYFFESLDGELMRFFFFRNFEKITTDGAIEILKHHLGNYFLNTAQGLYSEKSYIHFDYGNQIEVTIQFSESPVLNATIRFSTTLEKSLIGLVKHYNELIEKSSEALGMLASSYQGIQQNIVKAVLEIFPKNQRTIYIPAGRSIYALLSDNVFRAIQSGSLKSETIELSFFQFIEEVRRFLGSKDIRWVVDEQSFPYGLEQKVNPDSVLSKLDTILKGSYRRENSEDRIYIHGSNNKYIALRNASSGQQESLWILMSLFYGISELMVNNFIIEEPEAHLFPNAQKELVELMAMFANTAPFHRLFITTHSPYILTSLNNLLYAYQVGQNDEKGVSEIIGQEMWLNPDRVAAYYVDKGTVEPIMEEGLVQIEQIDAVSAALNIKFDKLIHFENE